MDPCDCQAEVLASYLMGIVSVFLFMLWYGTKRK